MKKGISSIIAVVLLLLIAIGIVWTVYTWLTGATTTLTTGAGEAIEKKTEILTTDFMIEAAGYTGSNQAEVSIRNTGSTDIDLTKILITVKGVSQTIVSGNTGTLAPDALQTITFQNSTAVCNEIVRVSYSGIVKEAVVQC